MYMILLNVKNLCIKKITSLSLTDLNTFTPINPKY